jgi:tRNA pseudouridine(38-40) synthase
MIRSFLNRHSGVPSVSRKWRTVASSASASASEPSVEWANMTPASFKKRRIALRVLFDGTTYSGSQIQSQVMGQDKSVEQALKLGLYRAGLITASNAVDAHKIGWLASSRLDRGVHSLALIVAAKLEVDPAWFGESAAPGHHNNARASSAMFDQINAHLPDSIRVVDACRVASGFNPRHLTFRRQYTYYLPADAFGRGAIEKFGIERINKLLRTFVGNKVDFSNFSRNSHPRYDNIMTFLSPPHAGLEQHLSALAPRSPADGPGLLRFLTSLLLAQAKFGRSWQVNTHEPFNATTFDASLALMMSVQSSPEEEQLLRELAAYYDQSVERRTLFAWRLRQCLWYHHEPTYERNIYDASLTPVNQDQFPDASAWFAVHIAGESFVYHQIRRMVGALGLVVTGRMSEASLARALQTAPFWTVMPLAPAGNLMLSHSSCYDLVKSQLFPDDRIAPELRSFRDRMLFPRIAASHKEWLSLWERELAEPGELPVSTSQIDELSFDAINAQHMFELLSQNSAGGGERDAAGALMLQRLWQVRFSDPLQKRRAALREARDARREEYDAIREEETANRRAAFYAKKEARS